MKKIYNAPEALEILVDTQDVITASGYNIKTEESGEGMSSKWQ